MDFSIVLACDSKNGIGKTNSDNKCTIPWHIEEDTKFFREITCSVDDDINKDVDDDINKDVDFDINKEVNINKSK
jgi:hypothetical protein